jgi:hypothetical protein
MELFLCDNCDTLAIVEQVSDTIKITKCSCLTLDWKE